MVVGLFMAVLDIQIVASSLRDIQAGVSATVDEISWIQTSYLIAEVVVIPISGWLTTVLSTRWLFVGSTLGFTVFSAACAFAWNIDSLIIFRALQGLFAGALIPTTFSAIYRIFPPAKQTGATIVAGLVATIAPTLGPTLGGWITQAASWHWLFLINIVPGILVIAAVAAFVRFDRPQFNLIRRMDVAGIVLMAIFLGTMEYVLEEGPGEDWFASREILMLTAVMVVSAALFFWREFTASDPVVDLRAFRNLNFSLGCGYSFILGVGLFGSIYLMPLFLGQVRDLNSLQIGQIMIVMGAFQFLSGAAAGFLEKRMDPRWMLAAGLSLFSLGLYLNGDLTAGWDFNEWFVPQAVRGFALMFCFLPITAVALGRLPIEEINNASGLYNLTRNLGGAIGLAVINTIFNNRVDLHYVRLAETLQAGQADRQALLARLAAALRDHFPDAAQAELAAQRVLQLLAQRETLVMAYNDMFYIVAGIFAAGLLLIPLLGKVEQTGGVGH